MCKLNYLWVHNYTNKYMYAKLKTKNENEQFQSILTHNAVIHNLSPKQVGGD